MGWLLLLVIMVKQCLQISMEIQDTYPHCLMKEFKIGETIICSIHGDKKAKDQLSQTLFSPNNQPINMKIVGSTEQGINLRWLVKEQEGKYKFCVKSNEKSWKIVHVYLGRDEDDLFWDRLQNSVGGNEDIKSVIKEIDRGAKKMNGLIDSLKLDSGNHQVAQQNINNIIEHIKSVQYSKMYVAIGMFLGQVMIYRSILENRYSKSTV